MSCGLPISIILKWPNSKSLNRKSQRVDLDRNANGDRAATKSLRSMTGFRAPLGFQCILSWVQQWLWIMTRIVCGTLVKSLSISGLQQLGPDGFCGPSWHQCTLIPCPFSVRAESRKANLGRILSLWKSSLSYSMIKTCKALQPSVTQPG